MPTTDARLLSRLQELLERAKFELQLAHDLTVALGLPFKRQARIKRAQREVKDELRDIEAQKVKG